MSTLTSRLLGVSLNISQWAGNKKDKKQTEQLARTHGVPIETARVHKTLLPMAQELDKVHSQTGAIRTFYYENTVPWEYGRNALKSTGYIEFSNQIRPMINEWRVLVRQFLLAYPTLRDNAALTLNGLYNPADYPDPEEMEKKFSIDIRFMPLPEAGHIVIEASEAAEAAAAQAATDELRDELTRSMQAQYADAMSSVWKRLYETAKHAHAKLSDPTAIFRDTLVENARELVRTLPNLNIADDPALTALADQLRTSLCAHTPEVLRQPGVTRSETARAMADIMSKMGAFYSPE